MTGTLARFPAGKQIDTTKDNFSADVEGDIEDVNGVLKITQIRVNYNLKVPAGKKEDAEAALAVYLAGCAAAKKCDGLYRDSG
jgi:hypothetical protein